MNGWNAPPDSLEESPRRFLCTFFLVDVFVRTAAGLLLLAAFPWAGRLCLAGAVSSLVLYFLGKKSLDVSALIIALGFSWSLFFVGQMRLFGWDAGFQQQTAFLVFAVFLFEHMPLRTRVLMALAPLPMIVVIKFSILVWEPIYPLSDTALAYVDLGNLFYAILTCTSVLLYFALTAAQQHRALVAQLESRRRMIADLSHELKTPLAAMLARTQLELVTHQQQDERTAKAFSMIERNLQGMRRLAKLMLDLTTLESGAAAADLKPVNPEECAGECVELLQPLADQKQILLQVEIPANESITGDPDLLRIVLLNLMTNAIRHSPEESVVTIRGHREEGTQAGPQGFVLVVEDEGSGIAADVLPYIFEPFYRGDESRSRVEKAHHGLGLSIAQRAAQHMNGRITVTSAPGKGSRFFVRL